MKKTKKLGKVLVVAFLVLSMLMWLLPLGFAAEGFLPVASAQETEVEAEVEAEVAVTDTTKAGILPSNPFYFLKEWGRGLRMAFTFNSTSKANFELDIAVQKLAEIQKVRENNPEDERGIERAVSNYEKNMVRLETRLGTLESKVGEERVQELLDKVAARTIKHQAVFEDIKSKHEAIREKIESAQEKVDATLLKLPESFDDAEKFRERMNKVMRNNDDSPELGGVSALIRLEAKANAAAATGITSAKEGLLLRFEGKIKAGEFSAEEIKERLEGSSLNDTGKLRVIEELREKAVESDLRNVLNSIRPQVIERIEGGSAVGSEEAVKAIEYAKGLIANLESMINSGEFSISVATREHLQKATFALGDAESLSAAGNFGAAFGQANAASVVAKAGIQILQRSDADPAQTTTELKARFDRLVEAVRVRELNKENSPELFAALDKAENAIVSARTQSAFDSIKRLLAEIEARIQNNKTDAARQ